MPMNRLTFHVDEAAAPTSDTSGTLHVVLYGSRPPRVGAGSIGGPLELAVARLGSPVDPIAFDFLSIALSVVAADTFVARDERAADGWARELTLSIPLARPATWEPVRTDLERALGFLSGDRWTFSFSEGGKEPPSRTAILRRSRTHIGIAPADCVCLFSGGLDSYLGARQLVAEDRTPLLVSHAYRGDQGYQRYLASRFAKALPRFAANANPVFSGPHHNDTTMRTRSISFLAFGIIAASALARIRRPPNPIDLIVPENGFIALNAPLTRRRIGSHSTRTTHPHFLDLMQSILNGVGLVARLENPYRHMTKGEMLLAAGTDRSLMHAATETVSCGKWKRKNRQCGHCVPCLIRRAAFARADIVDTTCYQFPDLRKAWDRHDIRDDIMAVLIAAARDDRGMRQRAIASGPLPLEPAERDGWFGVHTRGLREVAAFLNAKGVGN